MTRIQSAAGLIEPDAPLRVRASLSRAASLGEPRRIAGRRQPAAARVRSRSLIAAPCSSTSFRSSTDPRSNPCVRCWRTVASRWRAQAEGSGCPARFQLVAAANPCPCGWYRSGARDCRCDESAIARYAARLSVHCSTASTCRSTYARCPGASSMDRGRSRDERGGPARVGRARERQAARLAPWSRAPTPRSRSGRSISWWRRPRTPARSWPAPWTAGAVRARRASGPAGRAHRCRPRRRAPRRGRLRSQRRSLCAYLRPRHEPGAVSDPVHSVTQNPSLFPEGICGPSINPRTSEDFRARSRC